ncbi:MAG TPA: metallophosphoesterase [Candidatus Limnocylindrales bacterium]|nr:metallophosphoesterase [Candidatus Limnocylindrales bacterium]
MIPAGPRRPASRHWLLLLVGLGLVGLVAIALAARLPERPIASGGIPAASAGVGGAPTGASSPGTPPGRLVGAGDIASCGSSGDEATARLVASLPGTVFTAGDNAYQRGTDDEFARCYDPTWGRFRTRTRPAPGNHDHETRGAAGYFRYFGAAAGEPGRGWYAWDEGSWRVYVLDSTCEVVGCGEDSEQMRWLVGDLAAQPRSCVAAIWHHPLFTSSRREGRAAMRAAWQALHEARAELVINGHEHHYERFAPQDPQGRADPARGIRQFVVGTGGRSLYRFGQTRPNSEVRDASTYGALALELRADGYAWRFLPTEAAGFSDGGEGPCH